MEHLFQIKAKWAGGREGAGLLAGTELELPFSAPSPLGGTGRGTNPEELLLGASSTCLLITLGIILQKRGIVADRLTVDSQLQASSEKGLAIQTIVHRLHLALPEGQDESPAREALTLAEKFCPIARALAGNVRVEVVADFLPQTRQIPSPLVRRGT